MVSRPVEGSKDRGSGAGAVGLAQLAEYILSAPHYTNWTPRESLLVFACTAAYTLALLGALWLGIRGMKQRGVPRSLRELREGREKAGEVVAPEGV